ncbi:MAG: hypothetical protein K8W52_33225 [Deltaproteobacteria bacterium]|nr:hypothetical protein [Deltaproteobacteria bacterium]
MVRPSILLAALAACGGASSIPGDASPGIDAAPGDIDARVNVGACGQLAAPGTWEAITPPGIVPAQGETVETFAFAVDPVNSGTVYLGTIYQHMWKSTDCGSTWARTDTGRNGGAWDHAMNWTFVVDPIEPDVVYTNSGYGTTQGSGLWKSVNGGADWDILWPPPAQPELATHLTYNFANVLALDPADHRHLLLTFHEECTLPGVTTCIAESKDAGATWALLPGQPGWNGAEGQLLYFLDGPRTWIWGSQTSGFFRTADGGATWKELVDETGASFFPSHLQGAGMRRTAAGVFYLSASNGVYRSPDGIAWTLVPNTGPIAGGLVGDGTTLYMSRCYFGGFCTPGTDFLLTSPERDGLTWTPLRSPTMTEGGSLGYDPGHHLLYSSNGASGFWRVVTE